MTNHDTAKLNLNTTTKLWEELGNTMPADVKIMAQDETGKMYSLSSLVFEEGESFEGARASEDMVYLKIEEI